MSWIGKLFGGSKAADKMIGATISGLDKLFYTKEEQSDDRKEMNKFAGVMFIEWQKNTQGQNLSRRILALSIAFTWLSQYWASMIVNIIAAGEEGETKKLDSISEAIGSNADAMTGAMMLLLGFYFAAPHLGKIVDVSMQKFSAVKIGKEVANK